MPNKPIQSYDDYSRLSNDVEKLNRVVFGGDNLSESLTLRLDRLEQHNLDNMAVRMDRIERNALQREFYFKTLVVSVITAVTGIIIALVKLHLH